MQQLPNLAVEDQFLSAFEDAWKTALETYRCRQAQLNGGSRLRPLMVLWGYLAAVDSYDSADMNYVASVAVSVELLHKATILLDDWIDQDEERHGQKAFHVEFDPYYAVILSLHMVSDSMVRLKGILPADVGLANSYYTCAEILAQTIFSMSKGALEELRMNDKITNLEHIKRIAKLETAEIIGNAMQLGYFAGKGNHPVVSKLFKRLGDQFGYLFQSMNDMEAFADSSALSAHKGAINDDISINRKNIGVALLYHVSNKKDQDHIRNGNPETIRKLMQKYKILDFVLEQTELFYKTIEQELRQYSGQGLSLEWISDYIFFMNRMRSKAYRKLGIK